MIDRGVALLRKVIERVLATPLPPRSNIGSNCRIDSRCEFSGYLRGISLGAQVSIGRDTTIRCHDSASRISIGSHSVIKQFAVLMTYPGGFIEIGKNCSVNPFSVLYGHGGLTIGDNVRIAAHCIIVPAEHRFEELDSPITRQGLYKRGVKIGSDVWLGAGTIVLDGCEIGDGCVVGAGSVVTRSLAPYSVAVGSPARPVRRRRLDDDRMEQV